jgi:peptide/nickel transport system substrate-binding protein
METRDALDRRMDDLVSSLRRGEITRRAFIVRSSAILASILASGTMAGFPSPSVAQQSEPRQGGLMRLGLPDGSQNDSLDPGTWSTSYTGASFGGGVYNNLVELLPDGSVVGDLAESWEVEPDATVWRFKLRQGITFHNGKNLTAEDVRQSLFHHMKPDSTSGARAIVEQIKSIEAEGDSTVVFTLSEGNADFAYLLSALQLAIFPALEGGGIDIEAGNGTGAFLLESFEPGIATRLVRNPNYHKNNKPYLDEVEFITLTDPIARLNALLSGEVDFIRDVDLRSISLIENSADFRVQRTPSLRHTTFDMDTRVAPLDNNDVRMALKYALDREDIIEKVFLGEARVGNDNPIASIMPFWREFPQRSYNIEKAKEHLAKAGLESVSVDLSAADNAFPGAVEAAVLYQSHAAPAGIKINVVREAADGYWENVWLKKPFAAVNWFGRPTMDWLFSNLYTSDAPWNAGWFNERFDKLNSLARSEIDQEKRAAYYGEMQQIIHEEGNIITVGFIDWLDAHSNRFSLGEEVGGMFPLNNMRIAERAWAKS